MNPLNELTSLIELFPGSNRLFDQVDHIPASTTPEPYKELLVHDHHMTVTLENFHQAPVEVNILASNQEEQDYSRKILLNKEGSDLVVLFGLVRFNFDYVTSAVKQEIMEGQTPLGRVLICHNVLRHIDLNAILKINCGPELAEHFQVEPVTETYGRMATIFCNNRPAVDLLEISRPLQ